MQHTPMSRSSIARLNQIARRLEREGSTGPEAVVGAAREYGLINVREDDESGTLYRTERNRFVYGWTNHASTAAGCGFDDQVD